MKLTIPWTPLLAVFTLSLGTLAEGAAIAASPHSPAPRLENQENPVLAQTFTRCAFLERSTELFSQSTPQPITLNAQTLVRILEDSTPDDGWIPIEDFSRPPKSGFIREGNVGKIEDCSRLVPPGGLPRQQPSACHRVEAQTLFVYSAPYNNENRRTRRVLTQGDLVEEAADPLENRSFRLDGEQTWLRVRYIPRLFERDDVDFEGWVKLYHFENNRRTHNLTETRECN
ncbi:hypothetical protein VB712_01125 [Spirulina sp. CCNP1310]|uniref:hypothetical protein n=1 Tax=Spirulina sp. CCNP1310 TaxID=3110249 RepID=UPI002B219678|nr:hypothetical protein [Spirulina sp. CCNP1310]MEA5417804.1 hypothetical protein [Spirulina sp. CCNP1310]